MKDLNKYIGNELKKVRESKDLSLRDAETLIGMNYSTIHSYETGRSSITIKVMKNICDAYKVNYIDLLQNVYEHEVNNNGSGGG